MNKEEIVVFCVGLGFLAIGAGMTLNERLAIWGLRQGRAKIWVSMLGEPRAIKLTRYFFGPVVFLIGLICLAMPFLPHPQ